jgi:hypothetical protein
MGDVVVGDSYGKMVMECGWTFVAFVLTVMNCLCAERTMNSFITLSVTCLLSDLPCELASFLPHK